MEHKQAKDFQGVSSDGVSWCLSYKYFRCGHRWTVSRLDNGEPAYIKKCVGLHEAAEYVRLNYSPDFFDYCEYIELVESSKNTADMPSFEQAREAVSAGVPVADVFALEV